MPIETQTFGVGFPDHTGVPQTRTLTVQFTKPVFHKPVVAAVTGFNVHYKRSGGDHHLGQLWATADIAPRPSNLPLNEVLVNVSFGLRDWSGEYDDPYGGTLYVTVTAETGPSIIGPIHVGDVNLAAGQPIEILWDGVANYDNEMMTWDVSVIPYRHDPDDPNPIVEQRIEVERVWFLRKGGTATAPDQLQLHYNIRNVGQNPCRAAVVVSAIAP